MLTAGRREVGFRTLYTFSFLKSLWKAIHSLKRPPNPAAAAVAAGLPLIATAFPLFAPIFCTTLP